MWPPGFALYLNRRTLLEGWDIEVALRRIAERTRRALPIFYRRLGAFPRRLPRPALVQEKTRRQRSPKC